MSLIPSDPFQQFMTVKNHFERIFRDFPVNLNLEGRIGGIRVDIHETEHEVIATCDIPGIERKEHLHIDVERNQLMIGGTILQKNEMTEQNTYRNERFIGLFQRIVHLPSAVSNEGVRATYKNGVLEVRMPKSEDEQKYSIDIDFHE